MNLCLILLLWLLQPHTDQSGQADQFPAQCPSVTNVQKTGDGTGSFSYAWTGTSEADLYEVWHERREGGLSSGHYTTTATTYTFDGLAAGTYTFYVMARCGNTPSGIIGLEEMIVN